MAMPIGVSFAPNQDDPTQQIKKPGEGAGTVQEAIRVLSLRLPRFLGASAPAPGALLNGLGAGAGGENALMESLWRSIMQGTAPQMGPGGPSMGAPGMLTTPHVTPGVGQGEPVPGEGGPKFNLLPPPTKPPTRPPVIGGGGARRDGPPPRENPLEPQGIGSLSGYRLR